MVSTVIQKIIDVTLARFGREPISWDDYIAVARELFPEELSKLARSAERQGLIKWIKDGMRAVANVDESDPNAPTVQLDLMPGLPAPAYLNVGSDGEPKLLRFSDALAADLRASIAKRKQKIGQIGARVEDLQYKLEWLLANQQDAAETVGQVCDRISGHSTQPPTDADDDGPRPSV